MHVPSLLDICVQAAASSRHWTVQRRSLERLPDHAANELLALLLAQQSGLQAGGGGAGGGGGGGRGGSATTVAAVGGGSGGGGRGPGPCAAPAPLRPATLELFRHCVTRVALSGPGVTAEWLAALAGFGHLESLQLTGCSRLTATALASLLIRRALPPAAAPSASPHSPAAPAASSLSWRQQRPSPGASRAAAALSGGSGSGTLALAASPPPPPAAAAPPLAAAQPLSPAASSLRHLDLSGCARLGDEALPGLAALRQLQSLDISETAVEGRGLAALAALTGLTQLQAGGLKSAGDAAWLPLLGALTGLCRLDLWGSDAGGGRDGGEALLVLLAGGLPHLTQLGAAWTPLATLPALPGLQVLDLRHCRLREVWWPVGRPGPLALRQLLLRGAQLSGPLAAAANCPDSPTGLAEVIRHSAATLEHLDLCEVGSTDPWVAPLAALAAAGDDGTAAAAAAPRLTRLGLSGTPLQPEDLAYLQAAPSLQRLAAAGTRAGSPRGVAALVAAGLTQLRDLDLSSAGVTDAAVSWLQQLTALTALNLSTNPELSLAAPPPPAPAPLPALPPQQQQQPAIAVVLDIWAAEDAADGGEGGHAAAAAVPGAALLGSEPRLAGSAADRPMAGPANVPPAATTATDAATGAAAAATRLVSTPNDAAAAETEAAPGSSGRGASGDGDTGGGTGDGDGDAADDGAAWPQLRRLNLLGTRVSEAGLRALLAATGSGGGGSPLRRLEQLKIGGAGLTDGAAAALAAAAGSGAGLYSLHSLLVRDAPLTGHGALLLAAGMSSLRRLELQACWLVSEQDAERLAAACGPGALVVVNGRAATAAAGAVGAGPSRAAATGGRKGAGGAAAAAAGALWKSAHANREGGTNGGDDLSSFDQRLRYETGTLLRLAASPLAGGGCCATDGAGGGGDGGSGSAAAATTAGVLAALPPDLRR